MGFLSLVFACLVNLHCTILHAQDSQGSTVIVYVHDFGVFVGADSKARKANMPYPFPVCKIHEIRGFILTHVGTFKMGGFSPIRIAKNIIDTTNTDLLSISKAVLASSIKDLKTRMQTGEIEIPRTSVSEPFLRVFIIKPGIDTVYSICSLTTSLKDSTAFFHGEASFVRWNDRNRSGAFGEYQAIAPILANPTVNPVERAKSPEQVGRRLRELITLQSWFTPEIVGEPVYVVWISKGGRITWLQKDQECTSVD